MKDRVFRIMSDVFAVPADSVSEDSSIETIEAWDSLQHMNLIFAIEEEFGITLDDSVVAELTSVKHILEALEASS
jgi:acyl carrier protein